MSKTIFVTAVANDNRVALSESNAAHPDGECYIVGDGKVHEVGYTTAVRRLIGQGVLVEVEAGKAGKSRKAGKTSNTGESGEADNTGDSGSSGKTETAKGGGK